HTLGGGCRQDMDPSPYDAQAVLRKQLNGSWIQHTFSYKPPCCQRLDCVVILHGHGGLQNNGAMIIAGIGEVHRAAAELHTGLEHRTVHALTVKSPASKSREQSGMHVHDTSQQGWRWVVERQKTSQHHEIDGVRG